MESSVDLFERQMATNQRDIKFKKRKVRRSSSLIISFDIQSQVIFKFHRVFLTGHLYFLWWKEKQLLADQIGWSIESFISPANSQLLKFYLFWKLDLSNWWNSLVKKAEMLERESLHKEMPEITEIVQILCTLTSLPHNINLLQVSKLSKKI